MNRNNIISWITFIVSMGVFISSLTQPAYHAGNDANSLYIFLLGGIGVVVELGTIGAWIQDIFYGQANYFDKQIGATLTWLANPFYIVSLILLFKSPKKALIFSLIGASIMYSFSFFKNIIIDEAGHYANIEKLMNGYWLWLSSQLVVSLGSIIYLLRRRS